MKRVKQFFKQETVLAVSFLAAVVSAFFVAPNRNYFSYIDFRVLALLYCLMVVVAGIREAGVFGTLAQRLCQGTHSSRQLGTILILLCFFSSMFVTNDVALITFVPFAILILTVTAQTKHLPYVITLQTVAANLGSMATPVGNPQNLYLYSYYQIPLGEFFSQVLPWTLLSLIILLILCRFIPSETIQVQFHQAISLASKRHLAILGGLFLLCLLSVLHILPWWIVLVILVLVLLFVKRSLLTKADFGLLATFVCFFIFVGNLGEIPFIQNFLAGLLSGKELIVSALTSQVISNVPAAVLLSGFTQNGNALLLGTNIGGLGTPIASLASLISLKAYAKSPDAKTGTYLLLFSIVNFSLLIFMLVLKTIL